MKIIYVVYKKYKGKSEVVSQETTLLKAQKKIEELKETLIKNKVPDFEFFWFKKYREVR